MKQNSCILRLLTHLDHYMRPKNEQISFILIGLLVLIVSMLGGWYLTRSDISLFSISEQDTETNTLEDRAVVYADSFSIPEGPTVIDTPLVNAPNYFYLFTHTEDPFNHELSEERWWRVGDMVESIASTYPTTNISWMIEFQGSDAKTISDRNSETGAVDYLLSLQNENLVEFGYHAHHDPTYINRPQNTLPKNPTYDDAYEAFWSWITCEKNLLYGGCVSERGGGLEAILLTFGEVEIVTGVGFGSGVLYERSAGSQAIRDLLPTRLLGFGFSDHGPLSNDQGAATTKNALMTILTPTHETSSSTFWMDNAIRINDNAPLEDLNVSQLSKGSRQVEASLSSLDTTRAHVLNLGIADKFLYTVEKSSPTVWGYAHPDSPELPAQYIKSTKDIERGYALTEESLEYLAKLISGDSQKTFVSSKEVVDLFTSDDYWNVDQAELTQIALWILNEWGTAPPNWVYDGEDFYSLSDAFALLIEGLKNNYPKEGIVSMMYGPWSVVQKATSEFELATEDLTDLLTQDLFIDHQIQERYTVDSETVTATQLLYALSYLYVLDQQGSSIQTIIIPSMQSAPETYDLLETLGCTNCLDSAWSLKPARFQE